MKIVSWSTVVCAVTLPVARIAATLPIRSPRTAAASRSSGAGRAGRVQDPDQHAEDAGEQQHRGEQAGLQQQFDAGRVEVGLQQQGPDEGGDDDRGDPGVEEAADVVAAAAQDQGHGGGEHVQVGDGEDHVGDGDVNDAAGQGGDGVGHQPDGAEQQQDEREPVTARGAAQQQGGSGGVEHRHEQEQPEPAGGRDQGHGRRAGDGDGEEGRHAGEAGHGCAIGRGGADLSMLTTWT
jgi:hypothetical protein